MYKTGKIVLSLIIIVAAIRVSCRSPDVKDKHVFKNNNQQIQQDGQVGSFTMYLKQNIVKRLDQDVRGLAIAYLLGDKTELTNTLKEEINEIGVTHLIVISGMHLVIMVGILVTILRRASRIVRTYFCCLFMLGYTEIVGLTPSLLRAGIVVFCHLIADYFGRKVMAFRVLPLVVAITLIINPNYLEDVGWQLSMLAYTGILVFYPLIDSFLFGKGNIRRSDKIKSRGLRIMTKISMLLEVRSGVLMALAVNLTTLPMILYYFGKFSILSIPVTIIFSPFLPLILASTALTSLLPFFLYRYLYFYISLGITALRTQARLIRFFNDWQVFMLNIARKEWTCLLLYIPTVFLYFFLRKKNIEVGDNETACQNKVMKGSDGMQQIGAYLVEWQKQLQLRYQQNENKNSIQKPFDKTEKAGRVILCLAKINEERKEKYETTEDGKA